MNAITCGFLAAVVAASCLAGQPSPDAGADSPLPPPDNSPGMESPASRLEEADVANGDSQDPSQSKELFDKAYAAYGRKEYASSFPIFRKLADAGFPKAYGYVGLAYELGQGVEKNLESAIPWYLKAIDAHEHVGVYRLGMIYQSKGLHGLAYELYSRAVNEGFARSDDYLNLAKMQEKGEGVQRDLEKAVENYRRVLSLVSGTALAWTFEGREAREALERLGCLFSAEDFNIDLPDDMQKASAERLYSIGLEKLDYRNYDIPMAFVCLKLAADKGHALAASRVSALLSSTKYPIRNVSEAEKYARQATDGMLAMVEGNADYAYDAGEAYEDGDGCEKDEGKAIRCYKIGAGAGDKDCEWRLAGIYQKSGRVDEAFQLYLKAAKHGQGMAMFEVAKCFEKGIGTQRDLEQAILWYELCAQSNYAAAHEAEWQLRMLGHGKPESNGQYR